MKKINPKKIKRILLTRTDRIGDVILSTPCIEALREKFPDAFIAMMVRPYCEPLVRYNPFLDEVIVYDKYGQHHSFFNTLLFALNLRKKKFDISLMLHPTNRVHIISFLAGIPVRIGYRKNLSFLLNYTLPHLKQFGAKHEYEYTLSMLDILDIRRKTYSLTLKFPSSAENKVRRLLNSRNMLNNKIVVIQPGASCPSKIWPKEKFVELIKKIKTDHSYFSFVLIGDRRNEMISKFIKRKFNNEILDVTGGFGLLEVAALLKLSTVLISNDSGPVHISSAVGTPVLAIFGRNQTGLSPKRWGPIGQRDTFIHKNVGCYECLAHNCKKNFKCINSVSIEEVINELYKMDII